MARFLKTSKKLIGLHPGSLVYVDDSGDMETININLINYNEQSFFESHSATLEKCIESTKNKSEVTWIEFQGLSSRTVIEAIGQQFGIHRLWLEDVLNTDHRPKLEEMDNMLFAIMKLVDIQDKKGKPCVVTSQASLFFAEDFVLSFSNTKDDIFEPIKERIRKSIWKVRSLKVDYLFYALMDLIVDQYFLALETMENQFESLEEKVTTNVNSIQPIDILSLKSEFLFLRKTIFPFKEAMNKIIVSKHPWIEQKNLRYFRDIQDHVIQIIEVLDYYNELTSSLMGFYQNTINLKMNEVMKVLTLFASLFIPLTFVVGIYGMNFQVMPELDWKYGYFSIWVVILVLSSGMIWLFKKKKWL